MEKTLGVALALVGLALVFGAPPPVRTTSRPLLGAKECTWGPSYWCSNLTASAGCHATKHCIQTVWQHKRYPEDTDSVCEICKNMVTQARDQLESNETMDEIRQVFEGSCKLIPLKVVSEECCKLADDWIPELVETLASQMNPDIVCSVAGLCNNANIDRMLAELEAQKSNDEIVTKLPAKKMDTCTGCHEVVDLMEKKFNGMSRDNFLQYLLQMCGRFSSFSDSCSNIIITYFNEIYAHMKKEFNSNNVCLMSGECSTNFHVHKIDVTPNSEVGVVTVLDDNLPCELCEQLIGHLRDLLVANTTEAEFEKVLEGLCGQTQGFKEECLSIVHEYYPVIYNFLTTALNSTEACVLIQICPAPGGQEALPPIMPLLSTENSDKAVQMMQLPRVGLTSGASNVKVIKPDVKFESQPPELMQLPIERMHNPMYDTVYNKELCTFCEYFLHYLQTAITDPKTEKNIEETIDRACNILPNSVNETCVQFVQTYGDALVALLAQEIDPSTICPMIHACPAEKNPDIEILMKGPEGDKPNCPLCLFAVTKLDEMIKDKRSKENIMKALGKLCSHLSGNVRVECEDFVQTYTDELIEMLIDDFKPQEVCVYLKLCTDSRPAPKLEDIHISGLVSTNEIPDFTANGKPVAGRQSGNWNAGVGDKPACVLCEFVMEKLQDDLKDKNTEDEIKKVVYGICNHMPKTVSKQCDDFVKQYADMVIALLISSMEPAEICAYMKLCEPKSQLTINAPAKVEGGPFCVICKVVIDQLEKLLPQNVTKDEVKVALDSVCDALPGKMSHDCLDFIKQYGDKIADVLIMVAAPGEVCSLLFLCEDKRPQAIVSHFQQCAVCEAAVIAVDKIMKNPKVNHSIEHVMEKACRALPPKHQKECKLLVDEYGYSLITYIARLPNPGQVCSKIGLCSSVGRVKREDAPQLIGGNKCTWGPGYWCDKQSNAVECDAVQHCTEKVWSVKGKPSE